jgi:hypothetical protein
VHRLAVQSYRSSGFGFALVGGSCRPNLLFVVPVSLAQGVSDLVLGLVRADVVPSAGLRVLPDQATPGGGYLADPF